MDGWMDGILVRDSKGGEKRNNEETEEMKGGNGLYLYFMDR